MLNQIGTYFSHLFSLSMFGLPVWLLAIIATVTATVVALAIAGIMTQIERKEK